jgi:hypothetical protein
VTGLAWLPHQQWQAGRPLLLAATQDGEVACWNLSAAAAAAERGSGSRAGSGGCGGLTLQRATGGPQPWVRRKKKEQGHCALGLAVSRSGLFVAVARLSLSPLAEIVK